MTTEQIQCFLQAVESDSFASAAEQLYMTQPTFSRQISALEKEFGFPLFYRKGKSANRLTEAGKIMYDGLRFINEYYVSYLSNARTAALGKKGTLRIGVLEGQLVDERLSALFSRFQETYPEIEIDMSRHTFNGLINSLLVHKLDLAISLTIDIAAHPQLEYRSLYRLPNHLVIPKNHPLAGRKGLSIRDFRHDTFLNVRPSESSIISGLIIKTCRDAGFDPKIMYVKDLPSQIAALEEGKGITAFNIYHQACNHPNFSHLPLPEFPDVEFCAAWLKSEHNIIAKSFVDLIEPEKNSKED